MSIDWYSCNVCSQTFPDCGRYGYCICQHMLCEWCYDESVKTYGPLETEDYGTVSNGCDVCKLVTPSDGDVLKYALTLLGKPRKELEDEMRAALNEGKCHE